MLLGATISKIAHIIDNDVNPGLSKPKLELVTFLKEKMSPIGSPEYTLLEEDIENFPEHCLKGRKVALICTSPPFFNYEEYDKDNESGKQSRGSDTIVTQFLPTLMCIMFSFRDRNVLKRLLWSTMALSSCLVTCTVHAA